MDQVPTHLCVNDHARIASKVGGKARALPPKATSANFNQLLMPLRKDLCDLQQLPIIATIRASLAHSAWLRESCSNAICNLFKAAVGVRPLISSEMEIALSTSARRRSITQGWFVTRGCWRRTRCGARPLCTTERTTGCLRTGKTQGARHGNKQTCTCTVR